MTHPLAPSQSGRGDQTGGYKGGTVWRAVRYAPEMRPQQENAEFGIQPLRFQRSAELRGPDHINVDTYGKKNPGS